MLLYEDQAKERAQLSAVRVDVHEWKESEEWYARTLGWSTVRREPHSPARWFLGEFSRSHLGAGTLAVESPA